MKIIMEQTCGACPEQYDLNVDDINIGYFRLRHGWYYAEYVPTEQTVFEADTIGDGIFDVTERDLYLSKGIEAVINEYNKYHEISIILSDVEISFR